MEEKEYKNFYELPIWIDGYSALMKIYTLCDNFPPDEKYSLSSQILRSANSIIANIAESHGRYSFNDKVRVLYISRGEICETRSHLAVGYGRKYMNQDEFITLNNTYKNLHFNLNAYIKSLRNR